MEEKETPESGSPAKLQQMPEDLIGSRIAAVRTKKGLNHDGLAKLTKLMDLPAQTGISRTTIRGYEVGLYKPGSREIRLLCQALEVTPTWLIFGDVNEVEGQATSKDSSNQPPQSEIQKFFVALHLLRSIDASERDTVYNVLHSIARLKHGENLYRASVIAPAEIGALVADVWSDLKEFKQLDQEKIKELTIAYAPYFEALAEKELGTSLSGIVRKPTI